MSTEITFTQQQLEEFGAKLEVVVAGFSDDEKLLLSALVSRGIQSVRDDAADVEGFLLPAVVPQYDLRYRKASDGAVLQVLGDTRSSFADDIARWTLAK